MSSIKDGNLHRVSSCESSSDSGSDTPPDFYRRSARMRGRRHAVDHGRETPLPQADLDQLVLSRNTPSPPSPTSSNNGNISGSSSRNNNSTVQNTGTGRKTRTTSTPLGSGR